MPAPGSGLPVSLALVGLAFGASVAMLTVLARQASGPGGPGAITPERNNVRVVGLRERQSNPIVRAGSTTTTPIGISASVAAATTTVGVATVTTTSALNSACVPWQCECQGFSDAFGTGHNSGWGRAQEGEEREWWLKHKCETYPRAGGTLRSTTTMPPWFPPIISVPLLKDWPAAGLDSTFWAAAVANCTTWGLNRGLTADTDSEATADTPGMLPPVTAVSVDVVSLVHADDFHVLLEERGMLSWLNHVKNIRMVVLLGRSMDLPVLQRYLRKEAALYTAVGIPPIHFVSEDYFRRRYQNALGCPYAKVCQQLYKLHVFELTMLADNVLIIDSDTAWGRDVQYLYPNGSVLYWGYRSGSQITHMVNSHSPGHEKKCTDMDGVTIFESLMRGPDNKRRDICKIEWCQHADEPVTARTTGHRHITHHMLFQRDVMADFHETVVGNWGGASLWDAVMRCWRFKGDSPGYCTGRFTEYEYYFQFVLCGYRSRVIEQVLVDGEDWEGTASECGLDEMKKCSALNILLKGCHHHRRSRPVGHCEPEKNKRAAERLGALLARFRATHKIERNTSG